RGEEVEHALTGHSRALKEGGTRLIGTCFLFAGKGEKAALREVLAAHDESHARIPRASGNCADAEDHRCHNGHRHAFKFFPPFYKMTTGHMPGFMRDHADEFAGRLDGGDEARMEEHLLTGRDKGVEIAVIDEMDFHSLRVD